MDNYKYIIMSWTAVGLLFWSTIDNLYGNIKCDCGFSDKTLKKLTVNENSIFRKILKHKEPKEQGGIRILPLMYIRVIPFFISIILLIISAIFTVLHFILPHLGLDFIMLVINASSLILYTIYELILIYLAKGLRL